ncbi:MAG: hypothetical protein Kow0025_14670 [Thermodesulfovibrionales bacterium]
MKDFMVHSKAVADVAVIYPQGYLNNIVGEKLEKECGGYMQKGINKIVLNFSGTEFINSIGISILLGIIERLKKSEGTLCFTGMKAPHREVFDMLGLTKYAMVFTTEDDALRHFKVGIGK